MEKHGKRDAAAKATSQSRGKNCATSADKQVVTFDVELLEAKLAHVGLVDVVAQSEANVREAQKKF